MIQFYCLAVLLNLLSGLIMAFADDSLFGEESFAHDPIFRLVLGVISMLVGFIKAMPQASGGMALLGDLLPVLSGFFCGAFFVLEYMGNSGIAPNLPPVIDTIFFSKKKIAGFACLAIAMLHFIIPQVIIF